MGGDREGAVSFVYIILLILISILSIELVQSTGLMSKEECCEFVKCVMM